MILCEVWSVRMTMQPCTIHVGHKSHCSYFTGNFWTTDPTVDTTEATHLGGCQFHNHEQAEKATDSFLFQQMKQHSLSQQNSETWYLWLAILRTCPHGGMVEHLLPCMVKCSPLRTQAFLCQVHHLLCCSMCRICPLKLYCRLLSLLQGLYSDMKFFHTSP